MEDPEPLRSSLEADCLTMPGVAVCATWDEESLVSQAQNNDARVLTAIHELYFDRIYRYIALRVDGLGEAEDITRGVFLTVLRSVNDYRRTKAPFSTWLYRIAKNQVIDHLKRNSHRALHQLYDTEVSSPSATDNSQSIAGIDCDAERLKIALGLLTAAQHEAIILRFTSELPIAKVASIMGISIGEVKTLQHSAVINLGKRLAIIESGMSEPINPEWVPRR